MDTVLFELSNESSAYSRANCMGPLVFVMFLQLSTVIAHFEVKEKEKEIEREREQDENSLEL